jgi:hypothetical protein
VIELQKPAEAASDGSATAWTLDASYQLLNEQRTVSSGSQAVPFKGEEKVPGRREGASHEWHFPKL